MMSASDKAFVRLCAAVALLLIVPFSLLPFQRHSRQWQAASYERTSGRIIGNTKLVPNRSGRKFLERLDLKYEYTVAGKSFVGDTFRYDTWPELPAWERTIIDRYPVGAEVTVFMDPSAPQNSLLEPGLDWGKLQAELLFWLALPGLCITLLASLNDELPQPTTEGSIVTAPGRSRWFALIAAGCCFMLVAPASGGVVGLTWSTFPWLAPMIWLTVIFVPFWIYRSVESARRQGRYNLTIDLAEGILTLPGAFLVPRHSIRLVDITGVYLLPANRWKGVKAYRPVIVAGSEYPVLDFEVAQPAETFTEWLADQLHVPIKAGAP